MGKPPLPEDCPASLPASLSRPRNQQTQPRPFAILPRQGFSWQDGSCATQLPPARRCASRIKRQKLWRYCAAKREALSSGVLGEAPSKIGVVSQLPSCHANPSKNFSFKKRKNCKNILPKCFRLCLLCFRIITEF